MLLKILPCPKLRLRAVKIFLLILKASVISVLYGWRALDKDILITCNTCASVLLRMVSSSHIELKIASRLQLTSKSWGKIKSAKRFCFVISCFQLFHLPIFQTYDGCKNTVIRQLCVHSSSLHIQCSPINRSIITSLFMQNIT